MDEHVVLVWSEEEPGGRGVVRAAVVASDLQGLLWESEAIEGRLLDVAVAGTSVNLVVALPTGEFGVITVHLDIPLPPIEPPLRSVHVLGAFSSDGDASVLPIGPTGVRRFDPRKSDSTDRWLLVWWSAPRELSFVELGEEGPLLPVETLSAEHGPVHPQRLVHEARRILAERREE